MNCPKCGEKNKENSKFCRQCGALLSEETEPEKTDNRNKIIIAVLAVIIVILAAGILFGGGLFKSDVPLESRDFEVFTMDVPVGAKFEEFTSIPEFGNIGGLIYLKNEGQYSSEVGVFGVSKMGASIPNEMKYDHNEGDISIFKDKEDTGLYLANLEKDDFTFSLMGKDPDTMVRMLNTIDITDADKMSSDDSKTKETSSTQTTQATAPATTALTILGGSISTGGGLSDKTYAKVFVGPEHAGENVKIQIWYSRDGGYLNNGNMVPKTVTSDGYIEVASASAYEKFPDTAEINIYNNNGALLDTYTVYLNPESGTQTF